MKTNDATNACPKCGAPVPAEAPQGLCPKCVLAGAALATETGGPPTATGEIPSLERVAAAFPQLEILELIGRGGMGFVFKARQPHLERFVALKLLPDRLARDAHFAERFNREGRVLARLNHTNIVSVYDFGQTGGFCYLLMEFVDGVNLRQAMRAGRFSPAEALAIVPKICEALQYAHEQGILHRDIKPENILLDAKGRVKIADFGIAKLVGDAPQEVTLTGTGAALGTPHYMAPEQLEKPSEVDHRADIYSLGVVFYEMLTGELPIGRFAPPSAKTPVDSRVDDVVFRALEKEREKRFQSADEVKTNVEQLSATPAGGAAAMDRSAGLSAGTGPHGTRVVGQTAPEAGAPPVLGAADTSESRFSRKAIWAAALVGFSFLPLFSIAAMVLGGGGEGVTLVLIFLGGCLPGLAGTLLGWMALSDLHASQGRLRGVPLALFAALTWPLFTLLGLVIGVPSIMVAPASATPGGFPWGPLAFLAVAAGTLTFAVWAIFATARWASGQPVAQRRGVLRWIFLALVVCGVGFLLSNWRHGAKEPRNVRQAVIETTTRGAPTAAGLDPIRVKFKVPKGQVATFMLCRHEGDDHIPLPALSGYVAAPDDEAAAGEVQLEPAGPGRSSDLSQLAWRFKIAMDEGAQVSAGIEKFGPLRLMPEVRLPLRLPPPPRPRQSYEMYLTHWNPDNPADVQHRIQPSLGLIVVFQAPGPGIPARAAAAAGSGTNWAAGLKSLAAGARPEPTDEAPWIRFTFTAVELREDAGALWLAMDYVDDVHGNCERIFRWDANLPRYKGPTRTTAFVAQEKDSPPVRHQRVEFRLPDFLERAEAQRFRDDLAKALVAKSVVARVGEDQPVFRLPLGNRGTLSAWVGAKPTAQSP